MTYDQAIEAINRPITEVMILDYVNNFLTVLNWAEHYGICPNRGLRAIQQWRKDGTADA